MPASLDIAVQRNEDWSRILTIANDDGPVDITGWSFFMQIKSRIDNATVIDAAGVEVLAPAEGKVEIVLPAIGPLHSYGNPLHSVSLPYDLIGAEPDGYRTALLAGYIILSRGVSA